MTMSRTTQRSSITTPGGKSFTPCMHYFFSFLTSFPSASKTTSDLILPE
jgi:hypothetical protein